ncbi:unnamed protein product [Macrosiphum euphorbiae]|uniref:Uncharacterized protein n=1 Tax=Macrosiphum euphorbiae TaxID=13131 RepID=A0AAV0XD68_9HEMI|nr:unnamed protein product [Macrosiphum euphorbiae]
MMRKLIKNVSVITKYYRTSAISNMKSCEDIKKFKIIFDKRKEYIQIQLMKTQSVECNDMCIEINKLESRLREKYVFSKDEDQTMFPEIKFEEPKIIIIIRTHLNRDRKDKNT